MPKNRKYLLLPILLAVCTVFSGCESSFWDPAPPPNPHITGLVTGAASGAVIGGIAGAGLVGAAVGTVTGGIIGHIIQTHQTLVQYLIYNGVQVVQVGDQVLLILPSDRFFMPDSANINPAYYRVLNHVGLFLSLFHKIDVRISGYTDNCGSWRRNLALSKLQAQMMVNYFWNYDIDARLLYPVGYGEADPIANNMTPQGRRMNRRIEITLTKIPPPILY